MTKFMQPKFSVYNNYDTTPKCLCGERITVGYVTQEGTLCSDCYQQEKQKIAEEKIKKLIKKGSE